MLLVSHDRGFLDNVVTSTFVFDGQGAVREYVGGYADWERQSGGWAPVDSARPVREKKKLRQDAAPQAAARKLKWKEARELEVLPGQIEALETEQAKLHSELADPELYRTGGDGVTDRQERLAALEQELAVLYARWEELDGLTDGDS